jgi:hypothetical protein
MAKNLLDMFKIPTTEKDAMTTREIAKAKGMSKGQVMTELRKLDEEGQLGVGFKFFRNYGLDKKDTKVRAYWLKKK